MVKALLVAVKALARKELFELAGAAATVNGLATWEPAAGWIGAGAALLAKSLELDLSKGAKK